MLDIIWAQALSGIESTTIFIMSTVNTTFSFADISLLSHNIAQIVVHENVEINGTMVDELHALLLGELEAPFSLLIDKQYPYSYDYEAQSRLGDLPELKAIAVVVYSKITEITTRAVKDGAIRENEWNMRIFGDRATAIAWLEGQTAS